MALKQTTPAGGSITITPACTAGTYTLTLPAVTDTIATLSTAGFAAGTKSLFAQAAAPTGWTQCTTHNNKSLRLVNTAGGGSGGTVAFTTAFASQTPAGTISGGAVAATTLTTCQIPSHRHSLLYTTTCINAGNLNSSTSSGLLANRFSTSAGYIANASTGSPYVDVTGGGASHTHSFTQPSFSGTAINLAVQYVDIMIATKS